MTPGLVCTAVSAVAAFVLSLLGVRLAIRVARQIGIMDVPNERSSHAVPTPRMGGVPLLLSVVLVFVVWSVVRGNGRTFPSVVDAVILFASAMALLGFLDDVRGLSPLSRFIVQMASAFVAVGWVAMSYPLPASPFVLPALIVILAGGVFAVWMVNLYNFMDGIDGLAGTEAVVGGLFLAGVFAWFGEPAFAVANLFVASASAGFLVFNRPPARIFLGDAGSFFLGGFFGLQAVGAPWTTAVPFIVLVLPFANFLLDTTYTLFRRVARGEKWYQSHRTHVYQRLTDIGLSHGAVTLREALVVIVSCVAATGCLVVGHVASLLVAVILFASLAVAGWWMLGRPRWRPRPD